MKMSYGVILSNYPPGEHKATELDIRERVFDAIRAADNIKIKDIRSGPVQPHTKFESGFYRGFYIINSPSRRRSEHNTQSSRRSLTCDDRGEPVALEDLVEDLTEHRIEGKKEIAEYFPKGKGKAKAASFATSEAMSNPKQQQVVTAAAAAAAGGAASGAASGDAWQGYVVTVRIRRLKDAKDRARPMVLTCKGERRYVKPVHNVWACSVQQSRVCQGCCCHLQRSAVSILHIHTRYTHNSRS